MKLGTSVRMPAAACLRCGYVGDGATCVGSEGLPSPDDITVCILCGHRMAFDAQLRFRELTAEEAKQIGSDARIAVIDDALAQMLKEVKRRSH